MTWPPEGKTICDVCSGNGCDACDDDGYVDGSPLRRTGDDGGGFYKDDLPSDRDEDDANGEDDEDDEDDEG